MITPVEIFSNWFSEELSLTNVTVPTACCLSTIGIDNYPNARFVSLKGIIQNKFIITGTLSSRKGIEIGLNNKIALTFWWTETERQVRIQGQANRLSNKIVDQFFSERSKDNQIVSIVSKQGKLLKNLSELDAKYDNLEYKFENKNLPRPSNWGGYSIEPIRIEFLEFKSTRFHTRDLYEMSNGRWIKTNLQP